jgi:hypothetical protein
VLELVLGRFPSDATILTAFTEHALEVAAAAGNASAAPSLNSTGPAALLTQRGGNANAAAAQQQQQQQLEVLVLEQLERAEEARAAAMKDEDLSYRYDRLSLLLGVGSTKMYRAAGNRLQVGCYFI